jgi:hypothetical protein
MLARLLDVDVVRPSAELQKGNQDRQDLSRELQKANEEPMRLNAELEASSRREALFPRTSPSWSQSTRGNRRSRRTSTLTSPKYASFLGKTVLRLLHGMEGNEDGEVFGFVSYSFARFFCMQEFFTRTTARRSIHNTKPAKPTSVKNPRPANESPIDKPNTANGAPHENSTPPNERGSRNLRPKIKDPSRTLSPIRGV